ncbi:MAG: hypothetical protein GXX86_03185 [Propionibacterium sp.]|nr:hypothetical protein [Propionibacterium sp.]
MSHGQPPQGPHHPRGGPAHPYGPHLGPQGPYPGGTPRPAKKNTACVVIAAVVAGFVLLTLVFIAVLVFRIMGSDDPTSASAPTDPGRDDLPSFTGELHGAGTGAAAGAMTTWRSALETGSFTLQYDPTGDHHGLERFLAGENPFAITTTPMDDTRFADGGTCAAPPLHLPILATPVALSARLPGIEQVVLDADTVAGIYTGEVARWDDPAITALNPDVDLPAVKITPVYRSDSGATTAAVTEWLTAAGAWTLEPGQTWPGEHGTGADGDDGVVEALGTDGALGYLPVHRLADGTTEILLRHGGADLSARGPEAAYLIDGSPKVPGRPEHDQSRQLDRNIAGAYPATMVSWLVVCGQYADPADATLVRDVFGWMVSPEGHRVVVMQEQSAAFSDQVYDDLAAAIDSIG